MADTFETVILAGGLSTRMGRDKARLTLDGQTLLARVQAIARATGLKPKVLRRDIVPRCGPLGGIYTALSRARRPAVLFLTCDMPLLTPAFLSNLITIWRQTQTPVSAFNGTHAGFPCLLPSSAQRAVAESIQSGHWSLQRLFENFNARRISPENEKELWNINTPEDLKEAEQWLKQKTHSASAGQTTPNLDRAAQA